MKRCSILNPGTLLPDLPKNSEPWHEFIEVVDLVDKSRMYLKDTPIKNPDLVLFTGGSSYLWNGIICTNAAVVTEFETLWYGSLPSNLSAQVAELVALKQACLLPEGKCANIYTDSPYAFSVCHATGTNWKQQGFITASGRPIAHAGIITELL